jgi:hypothetical protein
LVSQQHTLLKQLGENIPLLCWNLLRERRGGDLFGEIEKESFHIDVEFGRGFEVGTTQPI